MKQFVSPLHKAAIWYAHHGYHIFPLLPGQKEPAVKNGLLDATTNTDQVNAWWHRNPNYNIGLACGPSDLVVLDFDTYKTGVRTDILFDDDDLVNSVMSLTPRGGTHVWFRQPADMRLTNARGDLPSGIDVRGEGGYIVAPPSTFEGACYSFALDHKPTDVTPQPLNGAVLEILTPKPRVLRPAQALETPQIEEIRDALAYLPTQMEYEQWRAILMAVHSVYPDDTGVSLCEEWSPGYPGEVAKKFAGFRKSGITIASLFGLARAHGWRPRTRPSEPTTDQEEVRSWLTHFKNWAASQGGIEFLKGKGVRRASELVPLLSYMIDMAIDRGTTRVTATYKLVAEQSSCGKSTAHRRVQKLREVGLMLIEGGTREFAVAFERDNLIALTGTIFTSNGEIVPVSADESDDFLSRHRADDVFATYPAAYARKRRADKGVRPDGGDLYPSLGATGWVLWPHLKQGGTVSEIAKASGLSCGCVRASIKKFLACDLLEIDDSGRYAAYVLREDAEELIDNVRPYMVTAHVGQMRMGRNHADTADYAAYRLRQRKKMDAKDVRWWENLRDDSDRQASIIFGLLMEQGYNPYIKVGKEKPVRARKRFDAGEEWRTWGRPLFDAYNTLGGDPEERIRRLTIANMRVDANPDEFRHAHNEMRERIRTMMMMSGKRAHYERQPMEEDEPIVAPLGYRQLELEMAA